MTQGEYRWSLVASFLCHQVVMGAGEQRYPGYRLRYETSTSFLGLVRMIPLSRMHPSSTPGVPALSGIWLRAPVG